MAVLTFLTNLVDKIKLAAKSLLPEEAVAATQSDQPPPAETANVVILPPEQEEQKPPEKEEEKPKEEKPAEESPKEEVVSSSIQPQTIINYGQEGHVTSGFDTEPPVIPEAEEAARRPIIPEEEPIRPIQIISASVTHDETAGIQPSPAEDTDDPFPITLSITTPEIGHAQSLNKVVIDAPAGSNIALTINSDGIDSGLVTVFGNNIFLHTDTSNDNLIWGKDNSDNPVFALYLDENDGSLWLAQFEAIKHLPESADPNQIASIIGKIFVTVTDNNSNTATAPIVVNFIDDGIDLQLAQGYDVITHDESPGYVGNESEVGEDTTYLENDVDPANAPSWLSGGTLGTTITGAAKTVLDKDTGFTVEGNAADAGNGEEPTDQLRSLVITLIDGVSDVNSGLTIDGNPIFLYKEIVIDGPFNYPVIVGRENDQEGDAIFAVAIETPIPQLPEFNNLWFVQYDDKKIDHPYDQFPDEPVEINGLIGIQATDRDGDFDIDSIKVVIEDDGISITPVQENYLIHDETSGIDTDNYSNDYTDSQPPVIGELSALASVIGVAKSPTPVISWSGTVLSKALTADNLGNPFSGTDSALDRTLDSKDVFLFSDSNYPTIIYGIAGDDNTDAQTNFNNFINSSNTDTDYLVFSLYLETTATNGTLWLVQYQAIEHPLGGPLSGNSFDELVSITPTIYVTLTNNDNTITEALPTTIQIQDDGIFVGITGTPTVIHDETPGEQTDGSKNDVAIFGTPQVIIDHYGSPTIGLACNPISSTDLFFQGAFNNGNPSGADPTDGASWSLTINNTSPVASGLYALNNSSPPDQGNQIYLHDENGMIVGKDGTTVVFVLYLDDSQNLYVAQYQPIWHLDPNNPDDFEEITQGIYVKAIDGDGDEAISESSLGVRFYDDAPTANADQDSLTVPAATTTSGNVITGIDPDPTPPDHNLVADTESIDSPTSIVEVLHNGTIHTPTSGLLTINPTALGGQFVINTEGSNVGDYTYTSAPLPVVLSNNQPLPAFIEVKGYDYNTPGTLGTEVGIHNTIIGFGVDSPGDSDTGRYLQINYRDNPGTGDPETETLVFKLAPGMAATSAKVVVTALLDAGIDPAAEIGQWEVFHEGISVGSGTFTGTTIPIQAVNIYAGGAAFDEIRFTALDITPGNTGAGENSDYFVGLVIFTDLAEVFEYTIQDADGDTSTAPLSINVSYDLIPPTPTMALNANTPQLVIKEDNTGTVYINANTNADSHLTEIVATGFNDAVDSSWFDFSGLGSHATAAYNAATKTLTITFDGTIGSTFTGSIDIIPPPNSDVDTEASIAAITANVTAEHNDFLGELSMTYQTSLSIITDAVIDGSEITQSSPVEIDKDSITPVSLNLTAVLGGSDAGYGQVGPDDDGSEKMTGAVVTLSATGLSGSDLAGLLSLSESPTVDGALVDNGDGTYNITGSTTAAIQSVISLLHIIPPSDFVGTLTVQIQLTTYDTPTDTEDTLADNQEVETFSYDVAIIDTAEGEISASAIVDEDSQPGQYIGDTTTVPVPVNFNFSPDDNENVVEVTINNIPDGVIISDGSTTVEGDGSNSITIPGSNLASVTWTQPANDSDVDYGPINFDATISDPDSSETSTISGVLDVNVDAVADPTTIDVNVLGPLVGFSVGRTGNVATLYAIGIQESGAEPIGGLTVNGDSLFDVEALGFNPNDGYLYAVANQIQGYGPNAVLVIIDPEDATVINHYNLQIHADNTQGISYNVTDNTFWWLNGENIYEITVNGAPISPPLLLYSNVGDSIGGIAFSPNGELYGVAGNELYILDQTGGTWQLETTLNFLDINDKPEGLSFDAFGRLWLLDRGEGKLIQVNLDAGTAAQVITLPVSLQQGDGFENVEVGFLIPPEGNIQGGSPVNMVLSGTFGDYLDTSEDHYFLVKVPPGWDIPGQLPAGTEVLVTGDGDLNADTIPDVDSGTYLKVWVPNDNLQGANGEITTATTLLSPFVSGTPVDYDFKVYAISHETNTSDEEPDLFDNISASEFNTSITITADNIVTGTAGDDDPLDGTSDNDIIYGLGGNDNIYSDSGNDAPLK